LKAVLGIGGDHVEKMMFSSSALMGFSSWNILLIRLITGLATAESGPSVSRITLPFSVLAFTLITDFSYTRISSPGFL
jgi:hypothetical protein